MFLIVAILAILLSLVLIVMVLLQPSKSGSMGGAFGTLSSNLGSTFGSRRTLDFLAKGTTWVAGGLAALCILANFALKSTSAPSGVEMVTKDKKVNATAPAPLPPGGTTPGQAPPAGGQAVPPAGQTTPPAGQTTPPATQPPAGQTTPQTTPPPPAGGGN